MTQGMQRNQQRTVAEQLLQQGEYQPGMFTRGMQAIGLAPRPSGYVAVFDENDNLVGSLAVNEEGSPVGYTGPRMAGYSGPGAEFVQPAPQREGPDREERMAATQPTPPTAPTTPTPPTTPTGPAVGPLAPAAPPSFAPGLASLRPQAQPMTQPMAIPPLQFPSALGEQMQQMQQPQPMPQYLQNLYAQIGQSAPR